VLGYGSNTLLIRGPFEVVDVDETCRKLVIDTFEPQTLSWIAKFIQFRDSGRNLVAFRKGKNLK
jgi:hypothetical protein